MSYAVWIPIKMGSKRLLNKNIRKFNGIKLYKYTLAFAKTLGYPIYVTTDYTIPNVPEKGITTIKENFEDRDYPGYNIRDAWFVTKKHIKEDHVILLQVTNPLRSIEECNGILKMYEEWAKPDNKALVELCENGEPTGAYYIFPKEKFIWDQKLFLLWTDKKYDMEMNTLYQFKIAEAIARGDYRGFL